MRKASLVTLAASAVVAGFNINSMAVTTGTWVQTGAGPYSWQDPANWTPAVPNAIDDVAIINTNITATSTINLDATTTLGSLSVGDSTTPFFGYVIGSNASSGSPALMFQTSTGVDAQLSSGTSTSNVANTISAPMVFNTTLDGSVVTGGTFLMTGQISGAGGFIRKVAATGGNSGIISMENTGNSYTGTTAIQDGILQFRGSVLSGQNSSLGNATTAIQIGTAASSTAGSTPVEFRLMASNDSANYNIDRGLDLSGSPTGGANIILRFTADNAGVATAPNTNTWNLTGPVTLDANRDTRLVAQTTGMTMNFTGLITGGGATATSTRVLAIGENYGGPTIDGVNGNATYRFANPNNTFAGNIVQDNGTVVIAGDVNGIGSPSPIGIGGSRNLGFYGGGGGGNNIFGGPGGFPAAGIGAASVRSVFMETGGTTFSRNITTGGGRGATIPSTGNIGLQAYGPAGLALNVINGYRYGEPLSGATNVSAPVTWSGQILFSLQTIGAANAVGYTGSSLAVPGNFALIAANGGTVNFTSSLSESSGATISNGTTTTGSSSASRVTINQFRNNPYLDSNGDGVPDNGLTTGNNANEYIGTPTNGIVKLSSNNNSWTGTTDIRGGTLLINQNQTSDTIFVNTGATLGGNGQIGAGPATSTIEVNGTINTGDSSASSTTTIGGLSSAKKVDFNAGSNFTVDLNSSNFLFAAGSTAPSYDRLTVNNTNGVNIDPSSTLTINLTFQPVNGTNFTILNSSGTITGTFLNSSAGSFYTANFNGSTYRLTPTYTANALVLQSQGPSGWAIDADGSYNSSSSWDNGVPNQPGSTAIFGNVATAIRNVTANNFEAPTAVIFDDTNPGAGYNISGTGSFGVATITSNNGNSAIAIPISITGSIQVNNNSILTISNKVSGAASVVVNNTGQLVLGNPAASAILVAGNPNNSPASLASSNLANVYGGGTNVSGGQLTLVSPGALPNFSPLTIGANALVSAADHGANAKNNIFVSSLTLAGATNASTGKLDLANNDLVVQNGNLATINNQVKQGFNGGAWNGSGGIVSTSAASDSRHLMALGVIQNSVNGSTSGSTLYSPANATPNGFDNATAGASTDVLVKYTYYGDANLDGMVDGTDYSRIDSAFTTATGTGWFNGDFNYDGLINGSDYTLIDNAFNTQGAQIAAQLATPTAQIAGGSGSSAVPEPTTLGLLGICAAGLLGRRRRHN